MSITSPLLPVSPLSSPLRIGYHVETNIQPWDTYTGQQIEKERERSDASSSLSPWLTSLFRNGFVHLSSILPSSEVQLAREVVMKYLIQENYINNIQQGEKTADIAPATSSSYSSSLSPSPCAVCSPSCCPLLHPGLLLTGYKPITHHKQVLKIAQHEKIGQLFHEIFSVLPPSPVCSPSSSLSYAGTPSTFDTVSERERERKEKERIKYID